MVKNYTPEKGDIVWLDYTPQSGHEQRGRRPAIVLSKKAYNQKIGLALFCPITSKEKGYPFEVKIVGKKITGCVLSDQIKSLDWTERNIEYIEESNKDIIEEIIEKIELLIE
ncbi:endoribonuclease MazF [Treponema zuelzerae]|uniref:Endoribonuclease MazF n=1 Tax=Teretinema zuelzerae TaxID=156 RepID=A0AAE3EFH7_9SPIR|nr:endoribonuclease MazF [Teretinema zuelzerae]MCD1653175.1 endoribonuclease MazF [Teretinema zuelzerae]